MLSNITHWISIFSSAKPIWWLTCANFHLYQNREDSGRCMSILVPHKMQSDMFRPNTGQSASIYQNSWYSDRLCYHRVLNWRHNKSAKNIVSVHKQTVYFRRDLIAAFVQTSPQIQWRCKNKYKIELIETRIRRDTDKLRTRARLHNFLGAFV